MPVTPAVLLLALIFGLVWQRLAGLTVVLGRYANERMVRAGRPGPARMDRLIEHRHLETMALAQLLQWVASSGNTGTLVIGRAEVQKRIFLED